MKHLFKTTLFFWVLSATAHAELKLVAPVSSAAINSPAAVTSPADKTKTVETNTSPSTPSTFIPTNVAKPTDNNPINSSIEKTAQSDPTAAPAKEVSHHVNSYLLAPGDMIEISVWKEEDMQKVQTLVAPDGNISFPLAGTIVAAGKPMLALEEAIATRLADYITDPVVNIKLLQSTGNSIFVIGKVNKPGQFPTNRRIDVLQALSLAGGLTVFADEDDITIQRRVGNAIKVFPFEYDEVLEGDHLEQNIILEPGDTVTVP